MLVWIQAMPRWAEEPVQGICKGYVKERQEGRRGMGADTGNRETDR